MAKVVFNIHNILSFTFTVQYKPVYLLLLCMYMYQSLHVMDYALPVVFWYHPLLVTMLCELYFDITPFISLGLCATNVFQSICKTCM